MAKTSKGGFYAVSKGRQTGVFLTWDECEAQVKGFTGAKYKKFTNAADAEEFAGVTLSPSIGTAASVSSSSKATAADASTSTNKRSREGTPDVEDESGWDVVYCDGACKGNGQRGSVAGVGVWWGRNDPRNIAERCPGDQTNNRAELIAILRILETAPNTKRPLLIKSDSQYSINCFKKWLTKWMVNGFRNTKNEPVKNAGIIRYLSAHLDARARRGQKIRLQYVKGHNGEEGNEGADAQANLGTMLAETPERDWLGLKEQLNEALEKEMQEKARKGRTPRAVPLEVEDESDAEIVDLSQGRNALAKVRKLAPSSPPPAPIPQRSFVPPTKAILPTTSRGPPRPSPKPRRSPSPDPSDVIIIDSDIDSDELREYASCLLDDDDLEQDLSD